MSLLTIVQQALGEIGLGQPATVIGNADVNVSQALALVNRSGIELRDATKAADYWPVLRKQFLFNLAAQGPFTAVYTAGSPNITGIVFNGSGTGLSAVQAGWVVSSQYVLTDTLIVSVNSGAGTAVMNQNATGSGTDTATAFGQEAYAYPSDLNYFIPATEWDRNFRWQLLGPINAQEWQVVKSGISPVGPRLRFRLMNGLIYVQPAPFVTTGPGGINVQTDLLVLEYCQINWVALTGAPTVVSKQLFTLDTDVCPTFPEDLLTMALKWRFLKAKGMAYSEELDEYEKALDRRSGRETVARALPLNARAGQLRLLNSQQVPDTGFGK